MVQAPEYVEIKRRRDPGRVVVGRVDQRRILFQIDAN